MSTSPSIQPAAPVVRKRLIIITGFGSGIVSIMLDGEPMPEPWKWVLTTGDGVVMAEGKLYDSRELLLCAVQEIFDLSHEDLMTLKTMSMLSWAAV